MQNNNIPKVGVGVMVFKAGKILMSKRNGSHGEGGMVFPGRSFGIYGIFRGLRQEGNT